MKTPSSAPSIPRPATSRRAGLLALAALGACGGGLAETTPEVEPPTPDCAPTTEHVAAVSIAEVVRVARESPSAYPQPTDAQAEAQQGELARDLEGACQSSAWSDDARRCLAEADVNFLVGCYAYLTDDQREDFEAKLERHVGALYDAAGGQP
jgi:hypothetical protein